MAIRIGINGFGRIGRTLFRILAEQDDIQIVGVNDIAPIDKLAYLLKYDTVMGPYSGKVEINGNQLKAGKHTIEMMAERQPDKLPWKKLSVDIVVEATGVFRSRQDCEKHLKAGAGKVLLTVPAKDSIDYTLVMGVNDQGLSPGDKIVSNASCTTNCLAPIAKILHENFGIDKGFMTTVHAYTNDQRLFDYAHKDLRRSRGANDNIIPTTTGAAKAVGVVLPALAGKLDGLAMRVPIPDGSTIDLVVVTEKDATVDSVNDVIKKAAAGPMKNIVEYCTDPIVSSDIMQNPHSAIFDSLSTMVINKRFVKVFAWYDNEWGYTSRLVDALRLMGK